MDTIWKSVCGFDGIYEVSNTGVIRSVERTVVRSDGVELHLKQKIKVQTKDKDGYMVVNLSSNGITTKHFVHKIVATAFVDGWFDGAEINHIDCNRCNNNASNLEWVSHAYNVHYAISNGNHICTKDISGSNNPNYGNHKLKDLYKERKDLAAIAQSRPGGKNGRARSIHMLYNGIQEDFDCIKECAERIIGIGLTSSKSVPFISTKISDCIKNSAKYNGAIFFE